MSRHGLINYSQKSVFKVFWSRGFCPSRVPPLKPNEVKMKRFHELFKTLSYGRFDDQKDLDMECRAVVIEVNILTF